MILPLCLGLDPGATTGIALVEPRLGGRSRLLLLRVVSAELDADRWAEGVFLAFEAVAKLAPVGRELVGWWELTRPPPSNGWMGNAMLSVRRGQLLQAASDAGLTLAGFAHVMPQTWASRLKLPVGKRGDGSHRLIEAQALVEMDEDTFRGLGAGAVDGAEAVLIAAARGVDEIARRSPISSAGKPAMKARIPRGRKAA